MADLTKAQPYINEIEAYGRAFNSWNERAKNIVKVYRDERDIKLSSANAKFNIFWANVQTAVPSVFSQLPKPEVTRRYNDKDPVARVAAMILERAVSYEVEQYPNYRVAVNGAVEDRFIVGRGAAWMRLALKNEDNIDAQKGDDVAYECTEADYVSWMDFGHNVARTWEEVWLVWRCVYLTKAEVAEKFGDEKSKELAYDVAPSDVSKKMLDSPEGDLIKKARIYECWDKKRRSVVFVAKDGEHVLKEAADTMKFQDFFPCPPPLFATTTTDSLIPVPDYAMYQDQAHELNIIEQRIHNLVDACRVAGVYDASQKSIQRLLTEGQGNKLIPVDSWAAFAEKGGLKGTIEFMPLQDIFQCLQQLYLARDRATAVIYEITGLSDIVRGASNPNETAAAQKIKAKFAGTRMAKMREAVNLFATNLLYKKAEIICQHFRPETVLQISSAENIPEVMENPQIAVEAINLLRSEPMRSWRIEISSDSMLAADQAEEKEQAIEFMTATSAFIEKASLAAQSAPQLAPFLGELYLFAARRFKISRSMESTLEKMIDTMKQPKPPSQPPEEAKQLMQMRDEVEQEKSALDQTKASFEDEVRKQQFDLEKTRLDLEMKAQLLSMKEQFAAQKLALDEQQGSSEINSQLEEARNNLQALSGEIDLKIKEAESRRAAMEEGDEARGAKDDERMTTTLSALQQMQEEMRGFMEGITAALTAPKRLVTDSQGNPVGVETVTT